MKQLFLMILLLLIPIVLGMRIPNIKGRQRFGGSNNEKSCDELFIEAGGAEGL